MPRFFMAGTNILGGMAIMKGRDAEHVRVLRLRPGEDMIICDGQGTDYKCRLVSADKEQVEAEVIEVVPCPAEPSVKVTVLCGLPKGDKTDYIIQKCVEAGAYEIMFFDSERCIAKPDKPEKKLERWQRIAEEAAKQSGRGIIPQVSWAGDFTAVLDIAVKKDLGLFMYETGARSWTMSFPRIRISRPPRSSPAPRAASRSLRPTLRASASCTSARWVSASSAARPRP